MNIRSAFKSLYTAIVNGELHRNLSNLSLHAENERTIFFISFILYISCHFSSFLKMPPISSQSRAMLVAMEEGKEKWA